MNKSNSKNSVSGLIIIFAFVAIVIVVYFYASNRYKYQNTQSNANIISSTSTTAGSDEQITVNGGTNSSASEPNAGGTAEVANPDNGTNINEAFEELWEEK